MMPSNHPDTMRDFSRSKTQGWINNRQHAKITDKDIVVEDIFVCRKHRDGSREHWSRDIQMSSSQLTGGWQHGRPDLGRGALLRAHRCRETQRIRVAVVPQSRPDLQSVFQSEILQIRLFEQVAQWGEQVHEILPSIKYLLVQSRNVSVKTSTEFQRLKKRPMRTSKPWEPHHHNDVNNETIMLVSMKHSEINLFSSRIPVPPMTPQRQETRGKIGRGDR